MEFTLTSSGVDLDKLTANAGKALNKAQRAVGREIAKTARKAILDDVRAARGSLRFGKRQGGSRYRLGTKSKIDPHGTSVDVTISANPAGFWSIVEYGSRAHEIVPRRARVLAFDGAYAMRVDHPGTAGRHYWAGAEAALERAIGPVIEDTFNEAIEEAAA